MRRLSRRTVSGGLGTDAFVLALGCAVAVVAITAAVHGAVGFGMNLLAVPVLAVLDPALVPGPAVAAGLLLSVLIVVREPARVDRQLGWAVVGLIPGTVAAVALLGAVPAGALTVPVGILVLVAVALSAVRLDLRPTPASLAGAGVASGFLATAAAIGGPPLALVYARETGPRLRSNLSAFFVVTALGSLVALIASGHFGASAWKATAFLLPGVVAGFVLSGPMRRIVDRGHTRASVLALSALAGLAAVIQGLTGSFGG